MPTLIIDKNQSIPRVVKNRLENYILPWNHQFRSESVSAMNARKQQTSSRKSRHNSKPSPVYAVEHMGERKQSEQ